MTKKAVKRYLQLTKTRKFGAFILKCQFSKCCNFFTSISDQPVKYCQLHKPPRVD